MDSLEYILRLRLVGRPGSVDQGRQLRKISHQEPGIHRNAVSAHTRTRGQDVDPGMAVGDADHLIDIQSGLMTDAGQLVCVGDVDVAESVFRHLAHLGGFDVRQVDGRLAEGGVNGADPFRGLRVIRADRA